MTSPLLQVDNLQATFTTPRGTLKALRGISFTIERDEIVGLVGESGCGKSVLARALMGLCNEHCHLEGTIVARGQNLRTLPERALCALRGSLFSIIFQDPMSALNPTMTIGKQIQEACRSNRRPLALALLHRVGIPNPTRRYHQYPHQLSGGMRQRVLVAIALACQPELVIADEPTTALDPELSEQILDLLKREGGTLLLISHDLQLVARHTTRILVMYAGQLVEAGPTKEVLSTPKHPYTQALLASIPSLDPSKSLTPIPGSPPNLRHLPTGCPFAPRCAQARSLCSQKPPPPIRGWAERRTASCWIDPPQQEVPC